MAKPRIFISSTYYDLKHVRAELERFIRDQGYEPILNEYGHIPYGKDEKLEEYCYKEIQSCDILISIIGGRYGSDSRNIEHSISNLELKTAIDIGKQVYIFIENSVLIEHRTYSKNKDSDINFSAVDNIKIYKFLDEVFKLTANNQIKGFESTSEIVSWLKEQWAGLFQRLLAENSKRKELDLLEKINSTSQTLEQLVKHLLSQKENNTQTINDIVLSTHPIFEKIRKELKIPYRIIFKNKKELEDLLSARGFEALDANCDNWGLIEGSILEPIADHFIYENSKKYEVLSINKFIFDESGNLLPSQRYQIENPIIKLEEYIPF